MLSAVLIHGDDFLKPKAARVFLIKRIIRVVPLYWFFTILAACVLFFSPEFFTKGKLFNFEQFLASLLFFPWYNSIGEVVPVLGVGWTLNFEMYFYIVFALTLFFSKKYFLAVITFIFIIGLVMSNALNVSFPYFLMIGKPLLLEFLVGTYIGWLYKKRIFLKYPKFWMILSVFLIVSNIFISSDVAYRVLYNGIPAAILIYSVLSIEYKNAFKCSRFIDFFVLLGSSSYSIYITHVFFYKGVIVFFKKYFVFVEPDHLIFYSVIISIIGGIVIYIILEKPVYSFMKIKYSSYLIDSSKVENES